MINSRLAAANRNHSVNRNDPSLHRLADRAAAADNAGCDFFDGIGDLTLYRPFCHPKARPTCLRRGPSNPFPRREPVAILPVAADLVSFVDLRIVTQNDFAPTSVLLEIQAPNPVTPWPKSSISLSFARVSPSIFATPSPISRERCRHSAWRQCYLRQ